jgi:hypothetical protein
MYVGRNAIGGQWRRAGGDAQKPHFCETLIDPESLSKALATEPCLES